MTAAPPFSALRRAVLWRQRRRLLYRTRHAAHSGEEGDWRETDPAHWSTGAACGISSDTVRPVNFQPREEDPLRFPCAAAPRSNAERRSPLLERTGHLQIAQLQKNAIGARAGKSFRQYQGRFVNRGTNLFRASWTAPRVSMPIPQRLCFAP